MSIDNKKPWEHGKTAAGIYVKFKEPIPYAQAQRMTIALEMFSDVKSAVAIVKEHEEE